MTPTLVVGIVMFGCVYAYFLYKKRKLEILKEAYYSEIKLVFDVTKTASKLSSEEMALMVDWVKGSLPPYVLMTITTNSDLSDLIEKYNLDEKTYLTVFNRIAEDITEGVSERFNQSITRMQAIYAQQLGRLVERKDSDVSK